MMKVTNFLKTTLLALPIVLGSCHSKKQVVTDEPVTNVPISVTQESFLHQVTTNVQPSTFLTSKVKFSVDYGVQSITLTGNLRMKRNEIIRLQLMAFGFVEAARLEFTKDYVLIMDRINKQYIKAPYSHIDFLRNNGINFHSLQALFWNELFQPNRTNLKEEDLKRFQTNIGDGNNGDVVISLSSNDGKMNYSWLAGLNDGVIRMTNILYKDRFNGNSQLNWDYESFVKLEDSKKIFPTDMLVNLQTGDKDVKLRMKLSYIGKESGWEEQTKISNKYREVKIDEILRRFMAL